MSIEQTRRAYVERLAAYIGGRLSLEPSLILGRVKTQRVVEARMLIAYKLRRDAWGLKEIGEAMGRDHSTVHSAIATMSRRIVHDAELSELLRGMPAAETPVFSEADLVHLYGQLTRALAEARQYADRIESYLATERVPRRVLRVVGG